jgi:VanZ family protein
MMKTEDGQQARSVVSSAPATLAARDLLALWGPVLAWMAAIFYVSSVNTWTVGEGPPLYHVMRKAGHIFEYAVLALLAGRALAGTWHRHHQHMLTRPMLVRVWWAGVALCAVYALTDEVHQAFVPRREFHLTDILIDTLSATAALGIWYIVRARTASPAAVAQARAWSWSRRRHRHRHRDGNGSEPQPRRPSEQ